MLNKILLVFLCFLSVQVFAETYTFNAKEIQIVNPGYESNDMPGIYASDFLPKNGSYHTVITDGSQTTQVLNISDSFSDFEEVFNSARESGKNIVITVENQTITRSSVTSE